MLPSPGRERPSSILRLSQEGLDGADIGAVQPAVYYSKVGAAGMLLPCPYPMPQPCIFDLAECACYIRASGKLGGGRFADFITTYCCCVVHAYTTIDVHGDAGCCDGLRRAARLVALRAAISAPVMLGYIWHHRLVCAGFRMDVAVHLDVSRVDAC